MDFLNKLLGKKKEEPKRIQLDRNLVGILQGKSNDLNYFIEKQRQLTQPNFDNYVEIKEKKTLEDVYLELQQKIKEEAVKTLPTDFFIDCLKKYLFKKQEKAEETEKEEDKEHKMKLLESAIELVEKLEEIREAKKKTKNK